MTSITAPFTRSVLLPILVACSATLVRAAASGASGSSGAPCVPLTADLDVTADVVICPGTYLLDDPEDDGVIRVRASNVTIDLTGVVLQGGAMDGWGILSDGWDGVTIRGGAIHGFRSAVLLKNGAGHLVEGCDLSLNRKRPVFHSPADFLAVWPDFDGQLAADQIGNGVVLVSVSNAAVRNCVARFQQNGIGLYQSDHVEVSGNDCSTNEGWGLHLTRSSFNVIAGNTADDNYNKVSTYCHDVQQDGCDTAALLVIKASNDNLVTDNSLRNSGDGVFSAAQEGGTHWGADRNRYERNDGRFAKHISFESTFSDQNLFFDNEASNAGRYGFWLGFSRNAVVARNRINSNATAGISNESTRDVLYEENEIRLNPVGVDLRSASFPLAPQVSANQTFRGNVVSGNTQRGLSIVDTHNVLVERNEISGNAGGQITFAKSQLPSIQGPLVVRENNILGAGTVAWNVWNQQGTTVDCRENWWGTTDPLAIGASIRALGELAVIPPHRLPRLEVEFLLGQDGPYLLRRVVNERADDANDVSLSAGPALSRRGNAQPYVRLGRETPELPGTTAGFRFRDVWIPASATILSARIVLPTAGPSDVPLALEITGEANDAPQPYEAGTLPATRPRTAAAIPWSVSVPWTDTGWARTPDLTAIVEEQLANLFWVPGNALAFQIADVAPWQGSRAVWAFDRQGYATLPGTPYEFRRYRKHRFAKLSVEYQSADGAMVLERELSGGGDDADTSVGGNEVHFGFNGANLTAGLRFPDVRVPTTASLSSVNLVLPTDGTYTNPLSLALRGEKLAQPGPYQPGQMPASRPPTIASVAWPVTQTWTFLQWHATPDLTPLLTEIMALPGWNPGNFVAFDVQNAGSAGQRRIWAFERQPRTSPYDFPEIGPVPFVPFLSGPVTIP